MNALLTRPDPKRVLGTLAAACAVVALAGGLIMAMQGPGALVPAVRSFLDGSVSNSYALGITLRTMVPIMLTGLAASLTFRGGLFDVGQPGYLVAGGLAAAVAGASTPGPPLVVICAGLLAGALAGFAWAAGVAWITSLTGAAVVVVSLIAANLADGVAQLLTARVFQDPGATGVVETRAIPDRMLLPVLQPESELRAGIIVAVVLLIAVAWWTSGTVAGHRLHMFGRNPAFAALAGTPSRPYRRRLTMIGGTVCGLAGALETFAVYGRYVHGTLGGSTSPAWMGVTLAIMVPRSVLTLLPVGFLLAAMQTGFEGVQRDMGIAGSLGMVVQALILVFAAFSRRTSAAAWT